MAYEPDSSPTPPLKRHPALQPLSREHMGGLIQSRKLREASDAEPDQRLDAIQEFVGVWRAEISDHFDDEERLLLPLTHDQTLRDRLLKEHGDLRDLANACIREPDRIASEPDTMRQLSTLLHDHIRWEERVYFEAIQREHPGALDTMLHAADEIESKRPGARARCAPDTRPPDDQDTTS